MEHGERSPVCAPLRLALNEFAGKGDLLQILPRRVKFPSTDESTMLFRDRAWTRSDLAASVLTRRAASMNNLHVGLVSLL